MRTPSDNVMSADVFVVFGITGDPGDAMTFRSLDRLEPRRLLGCSPGHGRRRAPLVAEWPT